MDTGKEDFSIANSVRQPSSRVDAICTYLKSARLVKCKVELISLVDLCETVLKPDILFFTVFFAIFWRIKRYI